MNLRYTGHPFVDVGVAVITAHARKVRPEDVTLDEMIACADTLKTYYCEYALVQRYLSVIFTNSHFVQSKKTREQKEIYADNVLFAFQEDRPAAEESERCVFFPELAAVQRAYRQHIPLLNGESIGNFVGVGQVGLPVSGIALLAIHAMPLGCWKIGNLLAFHQLSDANDRDPGQLMLILAYKALSSYQRALVGISPSQSEGSLPSFGDHARTRFVDGLMQARSEIDRRNRSYYHVTGYYFTNYGPAPNIEILRLTNDVLDFLDEAQLDFPDAWRRVVANGWARPKKEADLPATEENTTRWRNKVYERLYDLPDRMHTFLWMLVPGQDWALIELALRKVLRMKQVQIDTYRMLGDRLAEYAMVYERGTERSFYIKISRARTYAQLRRVLRNAAEKVERKSSETHTGEPLLSYDVFIHAFEHPGNVYSGWVFARDLIAIRMLEVLQRNNVELDDLPEEEPTNEDEL